MNAKTISPIELNLNSEGFILKEDKVDSSEHISNVKWYDVMKIKVRSLRLDNEGKHVLINEDSSDKMKFPVDDDQSIFATKNDALEVQLEANQAQRERNAAEMKRKRDKLAELEEQIENMKIHIGKAEEVDEFFNSLEEKTLNGEIYQS